MKKYKVGGLFSGVGGIELGFRNQDFDIAWVEEAQTLSNHSLKLLRPTIRKESSELWFSWNPRHDTDAVDAFFRGGSQRRGMISVEVNHDDNPWFPEVLKMEMEDDYSDDDF